MDDPFATKIKYIFKKEEKQKQSQKVKKNTCKECPLCQAIWILQKETMIETYLSAGVDGVYQLESLKICI